MSNRIFIGTSGWNYKHWLGRFYPEKMRAAEMLKTLALVAGCTLPSYGRKAGDFEVTIHRFCHFGLKIPQDPAKISGYDLNLSRVYRGSVSGVNYDT